MATRARTAMRCGKATLATALGLGGLGFGVINAVPAHAAPAVLTTVTFNNVNNETPFLVPAAVSTLHVVAVGAAGGTAAGGIGGNGATVTADVAVTPQSTIFVNVGVGAGGAGSGSGAAAGGESDIRTCSAFTTNCILPTGPNDTRLLVAGGGGGAGSPTSDVGGAAGFASSNPITGPIPAAGHCEAGTAGTGGGAGGQCPPTAGTLEGGGIGSGTGGGGGGGYGGGLSNATGGGGGGSSFASAAASAVSMVTSTTGAASVTISYTLEPDLSVTKAGSGSVRAGGTTTYSLMVANNGPVDATGVTLTDTLPTGVTFVSASPASANCTQTAGVVTCMIGSMPVATSPPTTNPVAVNITVKVPDNATGTLTNTATVKGNEPDPNLANNTATLTSTVTPAIHEGHDGNPGRDGHDGNPGRDGHDGNPGHDGQPGHDGRDGHSGRDGRDWHGQPCNFDNPDFPFCDA